MYDRDKVKLPPYDGSGKLQRKHPLVWALQQAQDMGITLSDVSRAMNVTPQTLWIWRNRAKQDRHFLLPAEQIPALSKATGVAPFYFRPDLWPNVDWRFR